MRAIAFRTLPSADALRPKDPWSGSAHVCTYELPSPFPALSPRQPKFNFASDNKNACKMFIKHEIM